MDYFRIKVIEFEDHIIYLLNPLNIPLIVDFLQSPIHRQNMTNMLLDDKKDFALNLIKNVITEDELLVKFSKYLLFINEDALASLLYPISDGMTSFDIYNPSIPYQKSFGFGNFSDDTLSDEQSYKTYFNYYAMDQDPRGYCILINNFFTVGTFIEMQRFRNIFYQNHFEVLMKKNLKASEIITLLANISERNELYTHDAFVFIIITHGNEFKQLKGWDNNSINYEDIFKPFSDGNCSGLENKPRLFFLNCCRGENFEVKNVRIIPNMRNFLTCYSTLEGTEVEVNYDTGTDFGKSLADSFIRMSNHADINQILTQANLNCDQPFEWTQALTKSLYFFPKEPNHKQISYVN